VLRIEFGLVRSRLVDLPTKRESHRAADAAPSESLKEEHHRIALFVCLSFMCVRERARFKDECQMSDYVG